MLAVSNALQVIALVGATASYLCLFFAAGDHDGPPVPDELGNATLDEAGSGDAAVDNELGRLGAITAGAAGNGTTSATGGVTSCDAASLKCLLRQIGEGLTIGLTVVSYLRALGKFAERAAKHDSAMRKFGSIARDATTLLALDDLDEQLMELPKLQERVQAAWTIAKPPPVALLKRFKADKGVPLYPVMSGIHWRKPAPAPEPEASGLPPLDEALLDEETRSILTELKLNEEVRAVCARFNVAFENMPRLPQPLPPQYSHATRAANMRDAEALAPLTHVTHPAPSEGKRLLRRMVTLYAKALELRMIHQAQARRHHRKLSTIQTSVIVVAGLISIALLVTPDLARVLAFPRLLPSVDVAASILAALLSLANAWLKFARHEQLEAAHTVAMQDFADLAFDIDTLFATLGALAEKAPLLQLLDWAAEQAREAEGRAASPPPSPPPSPSSSPSSSSSPS